MEEKKQSQEEKKEKIYKGLAYMLVFLIIVVIFFLCAQICILEKDIESLYSQMEEMKISLGVVDAEPSPTPKTQTQEPVTVSGNDAGGVEIVERPIVSAQDTVEAAHKVYLTFDDGPSANTEAILDILDEYNVKATFFVLGKEDEVSKERIRMIYERGHTVGMHSYSHVYSDIYESMESFEEDFWKIRQYLFDVIGAESVFYRFPGGSSNTASQIEMQECIDFLTVQGVEYYDWNVSSGDGGSHGLSVENIVKNSTSTIQNYETSIILMHDASSKKETVEALPEIIETILAMEDTTILPITESSKAIHHVIR